MQGWNARTYTAVGLGVILLLGVWRLLVRYAIVTVDATRRSGYGCAKVGLSS
jgi:hypothetical protein